MLVMAMAALSVVFAHPAVGNAEPAPPYDAFYDLPAGWASAQPGYVLKSRPVQVRQFQLLPLNVRAWQLLYLSLIHI